MKTMEQKREVKAGNHKSILAKKRNGRLRNYVLYYILYTVHLTAFYVYKTKYINETVKSISNRKRAFRINYNLFHFINYFAEPLFGN